MQSRLKDGGKRLSAVRKGGVPGSVASGLAAKLTDRDLRRIFDISPTSIWIEDFSSVKERLDALRREGVSDLRKHFAKHPEEIISMAARVRILAVNRATLKLYEAASQRELMRGLSFVFDKASYDAFREEIIALSKGQTEYESEVITRSLKGDLRRGLLSLIAIPSSRNDLSRVLVFITDITALTASQRDAQQSEAKYRAIIKKAPEAFLVTDAGTGIVLESNQRAEKLFGIPAEQITGMRYTQLFSDESPPQSVGPPQERDAEGRWFSNEVIVRLEDGERVPVAASSCLKNIRGRSCVLTIVRVRDSDRPGSIPTNARGGLPKGQPGIEDMVERLSRREKEVVRLVSAGMTNRQIAKSLFLSVKTIETHRARIMEKLGFHKTAQIVRFAVYSGLCGDTPE